MAPISWIKVLSAHLLHAHWSRNFLLPWHSRIFKEQGVPLIAWIGDTSGSRSGTIQKQGLPGSGVEVVGGTLETVKEMGSIVYA